MQSAMQLLSQRNSFALRAPTSTTRHAGAIPRPAPRHRQRCAPAASHGHGRGPVVSDDSPITASWATPLAKARMAASLSLAKDFAALNGISFLLSAYSQHMGLLDAVMAPRFALLSFDVGLVLFIWRVANMSIFDPAHAQQLPGGATYLHYYSAFDLDTAKEVDRELHSLRLELLKKDAALLTLQRYLFDDKE